jgi:hypothetical protein
MNEAELARSFGELALDEEEQRSVAPALIALASWTAEPSPTDTRALVQHLESLLPAQAPVRTVSRTTIGLSNEVEYLIRVAVAQMTVLHAGFWIGSLVVMAVGGLLAASQQDGSKSVVLYLAGPLLAYLGTAVGFRAESLGVLEFEFACPITPRQLTVARLLVIVGYQTVAGIVLTIAFSAVIGSTVSQLVATWLAPLLLGTGVTLLWSLRFPVAWAGAAVYAGWVSAVVLAWRFGWINSAASLPVELGIAGLGIAAIAAAVGWLPAALPSILDRKRLSVA